ncbi:unnamed protein product [Camellia sinensis]
MLSEDTTLSNHIVSDLHEMLAVIYGADHDIMWLQNDFGIHICKLSDTGVAAYSNGHAKVYELLDPLELKT